jgi:hypothetical protein
MEFYRRLDAWRDAENCAPAAVAAGVVVDLTIPTTDGADVLVREAEGDDALDAVASDALDVLLVAPADQCVPPVSFLGRADGSRGSIGEALLRRTNLSRFTSPWLQPPAEHGAIYAPSVAVYRDRTSADVRGRTHQLIDVALVCLPSFELAVQLARKTGHNRVVLALR